MVADLTRLLGLPAHYGPHASQEYMQEYSTPGTVDPMVPTTVRQDDDPHADRLSQAMDSRAGLEYLMDCLYKVVSEPQFEVYGPVTVGGKSQASLSQIANVTGTGSVYTIGNPFDNDAEWSVLGASFGAAGQAILSNDPIMVGPALSVFYDGSSIVRAIPFFASGVAQFTYARETWFPIAASDSLFWAVNMAAANTSSALVTVAFRRRLDRHGKYKLTVR
jgi:hypothetical protein